MKIKGAELQDFLLTGWPEPHDDWFWDHEEFDADPDPDPLATYDTDDLGAIMYQGRGGEAMQDIDVASAIRRWRKAKTHEALVVHVPKAAVADFKAYLKAIGGTTA